MSSYEDNYKAGLDRLRQWAAAQEQALPDDAWKLPKHCPIWSMGLSLAQADAMLSVIRSERGER